jgi:hypothetical protein
MKGGFYSPKFLEKFQHELFRTTKRGELIDRGKGREANSWASDEMMRAFVSGTGVDEDTLERIIQSVGIEHPRWLAIQTDASGDEVTKYSQEFLDALETAVLDHVVKEEEVQ